MWQTITMLSFFPQYRHDDQLWKQEIWKNQHAAREPEEKWIPVGVSWAKRFLKNSFDLCKSKVFMRVCITNSERKKTIWGLPKVFIKNHGAICDSVFL